MTTKYDGGPAFPHQAVEGWWAGMSLRDCFAASALPAVYAAAFQNQSTSQESIAAEAYELAEAMLAERDKS